MVRSGFFSGIVFLVFSIFLIIIGVVLTISLVFAFIGVPMLIVGGVLLIISILSLVFGTLGGVLYWLRWPFRKKVKKEKRKKDKVIDVEEEGGVYRAKGKVF